MNFFNKITLRRKKFPLYLSLALIFILTSVIYEFFVERDKPAEKQAKIFQSNLLEAEELLISNLKVFSSPEYFFNDLRTDSLVLSATKNKFSFFFFKYADDSLTYWSDNAVAIPEVFSGSFKNGSIISLSNGLYFYRDTLIENNRLAGLFLIKRNYPYQNIYLENRFQGAFSLPPETNIFFDEGSLNIYNHDNQFLCSLWLSPEATPSGAAVYILLILYSLAFLALSASIFHLYLQFRSFLRSNLLLLIAFSVDIIILRVFMFVFKFPSFLYNSSLFSPETYAVSAYIPSLGDLYFNALGLAVIAYALYVTFRNVNIKQKKSIARRYFLIFSLFLHIFIFYKIFLWAAESLVLDASYSVNLNQFFFLTPPSFVALLIFAILLFSYFLISYRILGLARFYSARKSIPYFFFLFITSGIYLLLCIFRHDCNLLLFFPVLLYAVLFYFLSPINSEHSGISFSAAEDTK